MSRFIFRADGNQKIGLGHVMRCLSIADAAVEMGNDICFVLADDSAKELVCSRGFSVHVLGSDYTDLEGELGLWKGVFEENLGCRDIFIIVDSYYVTERYLRALKEDRKVAYIDDLAEFPYPVDVLINYSFYADAKVYVELYHGETPRMLLGVEYVPLRKMFCDVGQRCQRSEVKDVLISTGGADPEHLALELVKELAKRGLEGVGYHVLAGRMNEDREELRRLASEVPLVMLHEDVTDMRGLICSCDLAVSAAGSTQYEICACGVPLVTYALADNQVPGMEAFAKRGLALKVGDLRDDLHENPSATAGRLLDAVSKLAGDYERRCEMGRSMQGKVDGRGAERCVRGMITN